MVLPTTTIAGSGRRSRCALLLLVAISSSLLSTTVEGFSSTLFQEQLIQQVTSPSTLHGVDIELPDFQELFGRIEQTSPLAKVALQHGGVLNGKRGLAAIENGQVPETLEWKTVESNSKRLVHRIEKIDNFQGHPAALIRFRCEGIQGPCLAHVFANFLTTTKFRSMWDKSVDDVYERYPVEDLDAVNMAMGFGTYGACTKVGVGYCTTKPAFGVDSREQLTMCGINECSDGSAIIWGTEMASWHDHLLPKDTERRTRAKSHLFATTMTPTGDNTFDVEYVLQLEIGGSLPTWLTTPIIIDNVKSMFKVVDRFFGESGGALDQHLLEIQKENNSLLMTP